MKLWIYYFLKENGKKLLFSKPPIFSDIEKQGAEHVEKDTRAS